MDHDNSASRRRRALMIDIARMAWQDRLQTDVERVPANVSPRDSTAVRCCIYKDRAITRYRMLAILGHSIEQETDELKPLAEYAAEAEARERPTGPILTVIDIACSACLKGRHFVTNVCRGCVARPCTDICPKSAIEITDGRAKISEDGCINCGLCTQVCPYHAIVYVPIPCEDACPVGAVKKDEQGHIYIDYDACIFCGQCMRGCPFDAIMGRSQIVDVIGKIKSKERVIALVAPAVVGQFPVDFPVIVTAIRKLGFDEVIEVAVGAEITAEREAVELFERLENGDPFMTSSCCPAYVAAVRKHLPDLAGFVSETATPMHYAGEIAKEMDPDAVTVFIGPCVAKRAEAFDDPFVDYVLTFEELGTLLVAKEIELADCVPSVLERPASAAARRFAVSGGVADAIRASAVDDLRIEPIFIDGLDQKSMRTLARYANGKCPGNLVEVMGCPGGCVAGPGVVEQTKKATRRVNTFAESGKT